MFFFTITFNGFLFLSLNSYPRGPAPRKVSFYVEHAHLKLQDNLNRKHIDYKTSYYGYRFLENSLFFRVFVTYIVIHPQCFFLKNSILQIHNILICQQNILTLYQRSIEKSTDHRFVISYRWLIINRVKGQRQFCLT